MSEIFAIKNYYFFYPYLRRAVGKIVGKNQKRQCWSGEKKREFKNSVFLVNLVQKLWWFGHVRPQTWKERAICLQKLQALVITFLII